MWAISNYVLLTATYCIGSFALMLVSLLETIMVTYLLEKDPVSQETETEKEDNLKEDKTKGETLQYYRDNHNYNLGI